MWNEMLAANCIRASSKASIRRSEVASARVVGRGLHLARVRRPMPAATIRPMIRYLVDASATASHTFAVELRIDRPAAEQRLSLPVWIPGSYLVREFARHLSALGAEQAGRPVPLEQVDKATWVARCSGAGELVLRYRVYAFDLSVRAAFLDAERGFFNGTGLCLRVEGREGEPHRLALAGLAPGWQVATTLRREPGGAAHDFVAADYDELVDHPVELGRFWRGSFTADGIAHEFVVAGALPDFDGETPARRHEAHLRDRDRVLARRGRQGAVRPLPVPAQRRRRGPRRARASRQHGPGRSPRAATCPRRAPRRQRARARRGLHRPARPDLARVLPCLERQAAEAARLRPARLRARELHPAALVLRRLHLVLRRPAAAAQRPDRRGPLPAARSPRR